MMSLKIAIIDDDKPFRDSLEVLFNGTPGYACVGSFPNGRVALKRMIENPPAVILLDIKMPGPSGIECLPELLKLLPNVLVIMLTVLDTDDDIFKAMEAGALGYILKGEPLARLIETVAEVVAGGSPMSASIARKVVKAFAKGESSEVHLPRLSAQERKLLDLAAKGYRDKEIAAELGLGTQRVRNIFQDIYRKLGARTKAQAIATFVRGRG